MKQDIWQARGRTGIARAVFIETDGHDRGQVMRTAAEWARIWKRATIETRRRPAWWWPFGGWQRMTPPAPDGTPEWGQGQ